MHNTPLVVSLHAQYAFDSQSASHNAPLNSWFYGFLKNRGCFAKKV